MTDLRTLAPSVVDAPDDDAARVALGRWLGFPRGADPTLSVAVDILAALDAADAQGYARALDAVADWAREQLPAAAERD